MAKKIPRDILHGLGMCCVSWLLLMIVLVIDLIWVQAFCMIMGWSVSGPAALNGSKVLIALSSLSSLYILLSRSSDILCVLVLVGVTSSGPSLKWTDAIVSRVSEAECVRDPSGLYTASSFSVWLLVDLSILFILADSLTDSVSLQNVRQASRWAFCMVRL